MTPNPQAEREPIDTNYSWDWCLGCPRENKCMLNLTFEQCQDALKKEREKVLSELSILIHEWEVVAEGTAHWSSLNRVYRKIESMRKELRTPTPGAHR